MSLCKISPTLHLVFAAIIYCPQAASSTELAINIGDDTVLVDLITQSFNLSSD